MPGKRTKEDTWTEKDLMSAIQGDNSKEKKHRSSRDKEKTKHSDDKREHKSHSERTSGNKEDKERKHRKSEDGDKHNDDDDDDRRKHRDDDRKHRGDDKRHREGDKRHRDDDKRHRDDDKKHTNDDRKDSDKKHRNDDRKHRDDDKKHRDDDRKHRDDEKRKYRDSDKKHKEKRHKETGDGESRDSRDTEEKRHRNSEKRESKHRDSDHKEKKSRDIDEHKDKKHRERKEEGRHRSRNKTNEHRDRDKDSTSNHNSRGKERSSKHSTQEMEHNENKHKDNDRKRHSERSSHKDLEKSDKSSREGDKKGEDSLKKSSSRKIKDGKSEKLLEKESKGREEKMLQMLAQEQEKEADDDEYNYDDDDFDDYDDDDFEDDDDNEEDEAHSGDEESTGISVQQSLFHLSKSEQKGINEVLKAISAENEKVSSQASSRSNSRPSTGSSHHGKPEKVEKEMLIKKTHGKINFVAASQKQINEKTAKKTKKRGQDLLQLIQLDVRSIDLFDMPPMTEYELYMKRFGQSDSKQTFTQTNDDNLNQEIQTDEIETESRWCQHSHDIQASGVGDEDKLESTKSIHTLLNTSSVRLNKFIMKSSQVCISLLEELEAGIEQPQRLYTESRTAFSDGYLTLSSSDFLVLGRHFCDVAYSPSKTNLLLTAYGPSNVVKKGQKSPKGLICVWNTNEPTKPLKLLTCESIPNSCCFSSGKASLAFAGMDDGVVAVWDLREPSDYHDTLMVGNTAQVFRTATFNTASLRGGHFHPVVAISSISATSSQPNQGDIDILFELASVDQSGIINIWIIVEVEVDVSDLSNIHEDLGLSPKGRVKLVCSGTISPLNTSLLNMNKLLSVTCFQVDAMKPNHLYAGTDHGDIVHYVRFGSRAIPKALKQSEGGTIKVNAIDISPWRMPFLLACYDDGRIHLFHLKKEHPILTWSVFSKGEKIVDVKWSRSKPNVFFAIDAQSVVYSWDLLESDCYPVLEQKIKRKDKRAIGFSFANDYASLGIGTPGRSAEMTLIYGDGSVEIHRLSKKLSYMSGDELDRTHAYFDEIT